jgi:tripartite-type tricarboxylate transporter receptor subunit TctC
LFPAFDSGEDGGIGGPAGYTLLLANGANTINATLYDRLNFDFIHDIAPIIRLATFFFVMD